MRTAVMYYGKLNNNLPQRIARRRMMPGRIRAEARPDNIHSAKRLSATPHGGQGVLRLIISETLIPKLGIRQFP